MTERPLIILVNSGYHLYREYLLKLVADAARVWLFVDDAVTWQGEHIVGSTIVDTLDPAAMIVAAKEVAAQQTVDGVLCWDEVRMLPAAAVAEALGVPGSTQAIANCRDKHATRTALAAAGVPSAESVLVATLDQARAAAARIGYPVVLKPRALGASFGVVGVTSEAELDAAFAHTREAHEDGVPHYEQGVLVEQWLVGPEVSVDCAVVGGVLQPLFVARKESGYEPYFEEVGHTVDADDPLLTHPAFLSVLRRAHAAVGFRDGITHTELRLCGDGPHVIEINCRLGGDFIPLVGHLATGVDPGRAAVEAACGGPLTVAPSRREVAAIRFFYPDREVTVDRVDVAAELPPSVERVGVLASAGQTLTPPPDGHVTSRYAYVITVGAGAGVTTPSVVRLWPRAAAATAQPVYADGIAEFVDRCNAAMPPDFYTRPLAEQRALYDGLTREFPYVRPLGVDVGDDEAGGVPVRVYRPDERTGDGVLIYLRGGGFVTGSLDTHDTVVAELAARSGSLAIAVDFRMAPEDPYPAAVEDCYAALCGLVDRAGWFGFDPAKVVVCGDSSGANMAVVLAMMTRDRGGPALCGQALISPVLDFTRWRSGGADAPLLTAGEMEHYMACYVPDAEQASDPYVSPLVSGTFDGLPPAYVMGAELDSLLVDSQRYVEHLHANGTPAELVVEPGLVHSAVRARGLSPAVDDAWQRFCEAAAGLARS